MTTMGRASGDAVFKRISDASGAQARWLQTRVGRRQVGMVWKRCWLHSRNYSQLS